MNLEYEIKQYFNRESLVYFPIPAQLLLSLMFTYFLFNPIANFLLLEGIVTFYYWTGFLAVLLLSSAALNLALQFTRHFDEKLPWIFYFQKRLIHQLLFSVLLPTLLIAFVLFLFCLWIEKDFIWTLTYLKDAFVFTLMFMLIVNLICMGWFLYKFAAYILHIYSQQAHRLTELERQSNVGIGAKALSAPYLSVLRVRFGLREEAVQTKDILLLRASAAGRQCFVKTSDSYFNFEENLESLATLLDPTQFYKVNRRYIVNRELINGYVVLKNRKIQLQLIAGYPTGTDITVSREQAKYFINWFEK